jgi:hypothetical protein
MGGYVPLTTINNVPAQNSSDNDLIRDVVGNKTDSYPTGDSLYALADVLVEHIHARQYVYPSAADPVTIQAINGAGTWSNGAWVQVVPAGIITDDFAIHHVDVSSMSANEDFEIDLANGTTVIGTISITRGGVQSQSISKDISCELQPANSQIQARLRSGADNGETCGIKIWYHVH